MSREQYTRTDTPSNGDEESERAGQNDWPRVAGFDRPQVRPPNFPDLQQAEREIPRLHLSVATPVVRDRWERLVTTIRIDASAEEVWRALTDPDALRLWLAVCNGSLLQSGRDCVLDFEDGEFF